ncbi:SDR family NAD(P)-dependent oxidoreductase [Sphingomonas solaris]|uniref:SDR family NAD(P)-dependent oxidoreductase n=1 Tax=Alterirhizorhabdus solaris TaxID=2529389 RepID=UPI001EF0311A|nr:SDR family oxidoreductase [Sphingomonas solaris]
MTTLAGKVAIVTGAGSGIGRRIATLMAERGARIVVAASREETAAGTTGAIRAAGGEAVSAWGDLADATTPGRIVATAMEAFGRVDILVNNAAVTDAATLALDANITEMDGPTWERVLKVNTIAPALLCRHAIPHMIAGGGGSIVMIASGRGVQGDLGLPAYGASKAALINLALNVATQYGKQGIRANSVVVGMVMTPPVAAATALEMIELFTGHHLTPYVADPQDIAEPVAFLASDAARFITGATLAADGGMTAHAAPFADVMRMSAGAGMIRQD